MTCYSRDKSNTFGFIGFRRVEDGATLSDLPTIDVCPIALSLSAPSLLILSNETTTQIQLDWTSNSGGSETGFGIERSLTGLIGSWTQIDTVGTGVVTYTDDDGGGGLSSGVKYYYRVRALAGTNSSYSNEVNSTTLIDFKTALDFDGVNDYVNIGSQLDGVAFADSHAWAFWMKNDAAGAAQSYIFRTRDGGNTEGFGIWLENPNGVGTFKQRIRFSTETSNISNLYRTDSFGDPGPPAPAPFDNLWHRIVIRRIDQDVNNYRYSIWVDGVAHNLAGATDLNNKYWDILKTEFSATLQSDSTLSVSNAQYEGALDNVELFNGLLSDQDIIDDYNNGNGSNHLENNFTPVFSYKFNEADEDVNGNGGGGDNTGILAPEIQDSSGNGYHGTLTNFAKNGSISNWVDSIANP